MTPFQTCACGHEKSRHNPGMCFEHGKACEGCWDCKCLGYQPRKKRRNKK